MRDAVDALAQTEVDPQRAIQTGTFDRLADNLGALSFLIDMLSVQPALAKSLFRFDPETGSLSAVMGQPERVSAFAELDGSRRDPRPSRPRRRCWSRSSGAGRGGGIGPRSATTNSPAASNGCRSRRWPPTSRNWRACWAARSQALLRAADDDARRTVRAELAAALAAGAPAAPEALPTVGARAAADAAGARRQRRSKTSPRCARSSSRKRVK